MAVFATQIQAVVVAWQVYDLTRDPLALAYVGLAQFLPMLCLLLPAGDLIDRFNRKAILASSWAVGAVCSGALWWLSGHTTAGAAGVAGVYAVLVLFGCSRAFSGPALQSLLPQVVPREQLAAAIAANSMLMRAASIGGPLLGGVLYALGWGPVDLCLVFCGLCAGHRAAVTRCHPAGPQCSGGHGHHVGTVWRRYSFHPLTPHHPGHHFAGSFCGAAGRCGGLAAHLRQRSAARRPGGAGCAAQCPGGG